MSDPWEIDQGEQPYFGPESIPDLPQYSGPSPAPPAPEPPAPEPVPVPPPPAQPSQFEYNAAARGQADANDAARRVQSGKIVSTTFGSELGSGTTEQIGG